jgi:hypothetical protein
MTVFFKSEEFLRQVHNYAAQFQWHFIPPNSPHFGGLWEAGVKVFKVSLEANCWQGIIDF